MQKIWFRKAQSAWYLTIKENGQQKQIRLLMAPNAREGRQKAEEIAIQELATRKIEPHIPAVQSWITVNHILDGFLRHSHENHEPATHEWYEWFFSTFKPRFGDLRITQLKKHHIDAWVKSRSFGATTANRGIGAIKRAFAWAVEEEHIPRSPIEHVRKPHGKVRDRILTPEERQLILGSIKDESFRDYVVALTLTGARPGEIRRLTIENVDLDRGCWVFLKHKTVKKTGKPRIIYLCPDALDLTKRLVARNPEGPLFRNTKGLPWSRNAIRLRFTALRKRHPELKGVISYTYRASFATDALEAGVPDSTVAALLGHTNTNTLHRFYSRLSQKVEHLKNAAAQASGAARGAPPPSTAA